MVTNKIEMVGINSNSITNNTDNRHLCSTYLEVATTFDNLFLN